MSPLDINQGLRPASVRQETSAAPKVRGKGSLNAGVRKTFPYSQKLAVNTAEAAHLMGGVSPRTIRRLVERGLLRASKGLRHLIIPVKEIERYLDETTFWGEAK